MLSLLRKGGIMSGFDLMITLCSSITLLCICCLILILFSLFGKSKKRNYESKAEDENINKEIKKDKKKKKCKSTEEYRDIYLKSKKSKKASSIFGIICNTFIGLLLVAGLSFAITMKVNTGTLSFNDSQVLVVKTSSMSTKHSNNTYLDSRDKVSGYKNTRIKANTLIALKTYKPSDEIDLYDIVAFKIEDTIIVHRVVEINNSNGNTLYTFRGDANPYSLTAEVNVTQDKIIGVYDGYQSIPLGYIISFLQSPIGTISILMLVITLFGYTVIFEKIDKAHDKRYEEVLNQKVRDEIVINSPKQSHIYVKLI